MSGAAMRKGHSLEEGNAQKEHEGCPDSSRHDVYLTCISDLYI
jgi:hypothetical protein